jgi:hypothetical protein
MKTEGNHSLSAVSKGASRLCVLRLVLSLLPVASFAAQYALSRRAGTVSLFWRHPTIIILDWIFVPFNYFVVPVIDWRRGISIFVVSIVSLSLNVLGAAFWQATDADPGHMITHAGVVLPAGWVHLVFSACETTLLVAFVFSRCNDAKRVWIVNVLAIVYFFAAAAFGYSIHHAVIISDAIASGGGLLLIAAAVALQKSPS